MQNNQSPKLWSFIILSISQLFLLCHYFYARQELLSPKITAQNHEDIYSINYGTVALCSVVKRESAYLDEWVDYYLGIGIDRIFIYDNSDTFVLEDWPETSNHSGSVKIVSFPGDKVQRIVYARCAKIVRQLNFTWVLFADVDEFLVLKRHKSVGHFLSEYCEDGALSINWRVFGTGGHKVYKPIPVLKRFLFRLPDDDPWNLFVKTFVRSSALLVLPKFYRSPHLFPLRANLSHRDTNGVIVKSHLHMGPTDIAAIYHYRFKSYEEYYENKVPKGSVFYGHPGSEAEQTWKPLPNGSVFDDLAWKTLLSNEPRYNYFDDAVKFGSQ